MISRKRRKHKMLKGTIKQLECGLEQYKNIDNSKNKLMSHISHEIRTLVNNILGITAVAKYHTKNEEKTRDYLKKINSSSKVLLNIINDVLDISAIRIDKIKIAKAPFSLKDVLSSISNIYYSKCRNKGVEFEVITGELINEKFSGDEFRVNQILLNIISNAYKFTYKGGKITVSVSQSMVSDNRAILKFVVTDTGVGVDEDIKEKLLKPIKNDCQTNFLGYGENGLGLTITKSLVDMMDGKMYFTSEKDKGSQFVVELPFDIIYNYSQLNSFMFKDLEAIISEKDKEQLIEPILKQLGVKFVNVSSIQQGLQQFMNEQFNDNEYIKIYFIDWDTKEFSPTDTIKEIREVYGSDIKIIAYSYDITDDEEQAKKFGADLFMQKPLFQSTVIKTLMSIASDEYLKTFGEGLNQTLKGKRILLAEDNKINSEKLIQMLNMLDAEVDYAKDGKVAVEKFKHSPEGTYDAILMNLKLPIMDGYCATSEIRASFHPQAKSIPIFAMTDNLFRDNDSTMILNGMNGCILKPVDTNNLYFSLNKI